MTDPTTLVIERIIDAPREKVFAAWTTRDAMERWYRDGADFEARVTELDVRVGGAYRVEFGPRGAAPYIEHGLYLEVDPPNRLVMTETLDGVEAPWADTKVTVELHDVAGKTRLVLTHEKFPSQHHRDLAGQGWPGFIDRVEALVSA